MRALVEGVMALLSLGVWATFAYGGHGDTGRFPALGFVTDMAHLTAAALWLGGVVALAIALRQPDRSDVNALAAARFSKLALPAVSVIVVSGAVQGWRQIATWSALWHTSYAQLLVVKVIVVVAIVVVASAAREAPRGRVVPKLRAAANRSLAVALEPDAMAELRNGIWVEVLLAVVVVGLTATLVVTVPGREAEAAAKSPVARTLHLAAAGRRVDYAVVVQPALPGENTIVVTPHLLATTGFLPANLSARSRGADGGAPVALTFTPLDDGRWITTAHLSRSGAWRLDLTGVTDPTADTASVELQID